MKKGRINRAKRAISQPRFRSRVEKPAKGPGAYQRKGKYVKKSDQPDGEA